MGLRVFILASHNTIIIVDRGHVLSWPFVGSIIFFGLSLLWLCWVSVCVANYIWCLNCLFSFSLLCSCLVLGCHPETATCSTPPHQCLGLVIYMMTVVASTLTSTLVLSMASPFPIQKWKQKKNNCVAEKKTMHDFGAQCWITLEPRTWVSSLLPGPAAVVPVCCQKYLHTNLFLFLDISFQSVGYQVMQDFSHFALLR